MSISKEANAGVNNAKITITGNESENVYNQILKYILLKILVVLIKNSGGNNVDKAGTTSKTNQSRL